MPTLTIGKRTRGNKSHMIGYSGKASLLALLDEAETSYLNLFDEAARHGWIDGARAVEFEESLSHLAIKYNVPQA
jgi:hypothetical protein